MAITVNQAITAFVNIRAKSEVLTRELKDTLAPLVKQQEIIETFLKAELLRTGMESLKGSAGTAFTTTKKSISIDGKEQFKHFIAEEMLSSLQQHMYKQTNGQWQPDGESDLKEHVAKLFDSGVFDLIALSANKLNCIDYMKSNDGITPPGIKYVTEEVVQIRKAAKK